MKGHLQNIQDDNENALVIEKDGQLVENLVFKGKIRDIYLNKDQDLEISFEKMEEGQHQHVTIPIKD